MEQEKLSEELEELCRQCCAEQEKVPEKSAGCAARNEFLCNVVFACKLSYILIALLFHSVILC